MLNALLDTNQLVSSLLSAHGPQGQLVAAWRRRAFVLFLAPGQIDVVADALARPKITKKYRISAGETMIAPHEDRPGGCRDPEHDYLLGCAAAAGVVYLVSGDADLLVIRQYRDVTIVDARHFLGLLPDQRR